jgi:hypothetical protein
MGTFVDFESTIGDWLRRGEDCGFHDVFILGFRDGRRMRDGASEQQVPIRLLPFGQSLWAGSRLRIPFAFANDFLRS